MSFPSIKALLALAVALLAFGASASTAVGATFEATQYPATPQGSSGVGVFKVVTQAGSVECQNGFHVQFNERTTTASMDITFSECKAFGFTSATVKTEGCEYLLHGTQTVAENEFRAKLDLECPTGKSIKVATTTCEMEIKSQTGLTAVRINNDLASSPDDITLDPEVTGLAYTVTKDGFACPFSGTGSKTDGQLVAGEGITLAGQGGTVGVKLVP